MSKKIRDALIFVTALGCSRASTSPSNDWPDRRGRCTSARVPEECRPVGSAGWVPEAIAVVYQGEACEGYADSRPGCAIVLAVSRWDEV